MSLEINVTDDAPEDQVTTVKIEDDNKVIDFDATEAEVDSEGTWFKFHGMYRAKIYQDWDENWWIHRDNDLLRGDQVINTFRVRISEEHAKKILQHFDTWE
jgi:hypothetical protein